MYFHLEYGLNIDFSGPCTKEKEAILKYIEQNITLRLLHLQLTHPLWNTVNRLYRPQPTSHSINICIYRKLNIKCYSKP